ncbi:MAG TPA: ABC transporter substrate-binding protein, partial [Terriglobales bacterium]|nr:ABC transporter substrate-binding protein [Terriglobales bacterium]
GLVGRGDMNEFFFLKALEQWGVDPRKITFIAVPGSQPRLAALVAGTIHATVLAPPFTFEAEKYGFEVLADFGTSGQAFPQSSLIVRREFLRENRGVLKKFLIAYSEAIHVIKTDAPRTVAIMKKYMRITDEAIAQRSYDYYSKLFSQPPLTEGKGIDVVLKFLATQPDATEAKSAKPEDFYDNSLLLELKQEGFFDQLK